MHTVEHGSILQSNRTREREISEKLLANNPIGISDINHGSVSDTDESISLLTAIWTYKHQMCTQFQSSRKLYDPCLFPDVKTLSNHLHFLHVSNTFHILSSGHEIIYKAFLNTSNNHD